MPPAALVQFGPVELDPPPDTAGADGQTSFCGNLTHLGQRKWVPQIPTHAPHDDVTWIVSPFEGIGCGNRHVSPYQRAAIGFSQRNPFAERWICSIRQECLSKLILFGEASLRRALTEYIEHHHFERNHQGKGNLLLFPAINVPPKFRTVHRRDRLGGLLKFYSRVA